MRKRLLIVLAVVLATLAWAAPGFAGGLSPSSKTLGANGLAVPRCDTNAVGVTQNLTAANVVSVTISNIDAACANGTLRVTVNNGTTTSSGSGTVPAGGGSLTVTITSIAQQHADEVDFAISGP